MSAYPTNPTNPVSPMGTATHANLLQPGRYTARLIEAILGETSTGKEQIVGTFELTDEDYQGRTVPWFGVFATPKMSQRVLESLRHCGWRGNDLTALDGVSDQLVSIEVEWHTWKDRTSARVAWVNRLGAGPSSVPPMAADKAKAFAARMAAMASATQITPTETPTVSTPPAGPALDPYADVPF